MARTETAGAETAEAKRTNPLTALRDRVRRLPGGALAWRIVVTIVGVAVIAGGIVLLPLPGPGWLIIFAGLGILATEYAWAARLLTWAKEKVKSWTQWIAAKPVWFRLLAGFVSLVIIAALVVAALVLPL
jgi:uncharacterized protein (TIGR02611 family)